MTKLYRFFDAGMKVSILLMIVFGIGALWTTVF